MKKIGLLLESLPNHGGTFQYDIAILDAVASLPADKYRVTVLYLDPVWVDYLGGYDVEKVCLSHPSGFIEKVLNTIGLMLEQYLQKFGLSVGLWRKISRFFNPVARALVGLKCSLWVFPSQNSWVYRVNVPSIASIHDLMHRYERRFPEVSADGEFESREFRYSNMCGFADGILVDSELGKTQVNESYGLSTKKIHVLPFIPPRYVLEARELKPKAKREFESKYRLPEKYIFYPAQFWLHKNHGRLIKAVNQVKQENPDISLVLAGSLEKNGYEPALKLINDLGLQENVVLMGYIPDEDVPEFYRRARALIMPTFFGPTNIPPLEAFILGCPVAISGTYGMREQSGDAAIYFDPESVEEIAGCIRRLWSDDELCGKLIAKGKEKTGQWGQAQFNQRLFEIIRKVTA
jgi:glycosyltransferase involved in cell wall biosynthesis